MVKRKSSTDDENEGSQHSEDDRGKNTSSNKKKQETLRPLTIKKPKIGSTSDTPKMTTKDVEFFTNSEGERYVDLGHKKRVTVREFKGKVLVDIREFYGKDGEDEKPGKKGISLNPDQWDSLKKSIYTIDSFFADKK